MIGGIGGRPLKRDLIRTIIEALRQPSLKAALRVALGAGDTVTSAQVQSQTFTSYTTTGTSSAYALTPSPAISGNAARQRFNITIHTTPTGSPTLSVSGQTPLNLKYYDATGTKQFLSNSVALPTFDVINDGTDWVVQQIIPRSNVYASSVRQTVLAGPVDTGGLPTFVPASAVGLTLTTQNITASAPLVVSAASGSGVNGDVNTTGQATANFSWPAMGNGVTWYGYVTVSGGALTPAWTGLAPIYQWGGTPSVTSGQLTYNIQEGKMYLGNGSTAPAVNAVVVAEVTSSGGNITAVTPYQYLGRYDSGFTATLPTTNTAFSKNHYLGMKPGIIDMVLECTSAEFGYQVGDQIHAASIRTLDGVPNAGNLTLAANLTSVFVHTAATSSFQVQSNTTGAFSTLTLASWKWKITASRGW